MNQDIELETKFIKLFTLKNKHDRYLQLILSTNKRKKFITELGHFNGLDLSKFEKLTGDILAEVKQKTNGINTCYAISENPELDTHVIKVDEALSKTVGYDLGTLLIFGDAKYVYYGSEEINERWISK